jgi:hypothetical protein
MAFCDLANISKMTCQDCSRFPGISPVDVFTLYNATTEVYGYTAYDKLENKIVLSYRGTDGLTNKIIDMETLKTNYDNDKCPGCLVH